MARTEITVQVKKGVLQEWMPFISIICNPFQHDPVITCKQLKCKNFTAKVHLHGNLDHRDAEMKMPKLCREERLSIGAEIKQTGMKETAPILHNPVKLRWSIPLYGPPHSG